MCVLVAQRVRALWSTVGSQYTVGLDGIPVLTLVPVLAVPVLAVPTAERVVTITGASCEYLIPVL